MDDGFALRQPPRLGAALRGVFPRGRADLHVHSIWSDGAQTPAAIVRAAAGRVDVLAITDHDEVRGALAAREFAREHPELGVDVVVGEEVSTLNGHVLALWIEELVPSGLSAEHTIALIHAQGGLAVAAHPFHPIPHHRAGHRSLATLIPYLPVDGVEVVNNSGVFSRIYDAWAALRNVEWMLPVTGGSDAHDVWYLGGAITRFHGRDGGALRRDLVAGRTRAHARWSWTFDKLPRHLCMQWRSALRFVRLNRRSVEMSWGR